MRSCTFKVIPELTHFLKPGASTWTEYRPMGRGVTTKLPDESVVVLVSIPVFALVTVTAAAAMTPPVGSATFPTIDPEVVWANAGRQATRAKRNSLRMIEPPCHNRNLLILHRCRRGVKQILLPAVPIV